MVEYNTSSRGCWCFCCGVGVGVRFATLWVTCKHISGLDSRALNRFIDEYQNQDEDLVEAIVRDQHIFRNPEVQIALLAVLKQPGTYLDKDRETINQSFATVLPERINRGRVDKAITYLLKCLAQELWHLPELSPIYSLQFQSLTAEAVREQVVLQKAQLEALTSLNTGIRDGLLQLTDALGAQKQLPSGAIAPTLPRPRVYHNLPQADYGEFIGREAELEQIFQLLRPYPQSKHHLVVIDGVGGIGKSTLALEVAQRCLQVSLQVAAESSEDESSYLSMLRGVLVDRFSAEELQTLCFDMALDYDMLPGQGKGGKARELVAYLERRNRPNELVESIQRSRPDIKLEVNNQKTVISKAERFEAIIWVTAKGNVLTGEGIVPRRQLVHSLDDIYTVIAIALQREDIIRARPEEQTELVKNALAHQRTLLIVDNLETIDDVAVLSFLRELPIPTKAIVTTRHRIDVAYAIRLLGMSPVEATELIVQECARKQVQLKPADAEKLIVRTGSVPIALVWCIAQLSFGYPINTILLKLGEAHSDVTQFIFDTALETIKGRNALRLLLAISLFASRVSREALGFVTNLPELERDDGLVELQKLSLVNQIDGRFDILPLTRQYLTQRDLTKNEAFSAMRERWLHFLLILSERSKDYNVQSFINLYPDIENIKAAIDWCWQNQHSLLIDFVNNIAYYLQGNGYWNHLEKYLHWAIEISVLHETEEPQARFCYFLAILRQHKGNFQDAMKCIERSIMISEATGQTHRLALALVRAALIERRTHAFDKARHYLLQSLAIADALSSDDIRIRSNLSLAAVELDQGNFHAAKHHLNECRKVENQINWQSTWWYRQRGQVAILEEDYETAAWLLRRSLDIAEAVPMKQNIAEALFCQAQLALLRGDYQLALAKAASAKEHFITLDIYPQLPFTERLIEAIKQAQADNTRPYIGMTL